MRTARCSLLALTLLAAASGAACAGPPATKPAPVSREPAAHSELLAAQRGWWQALATADLAYLEAHTAAEHSLTLSAGGSYDRAAMLAQASASPQGGDVQFEWADERVRFPEPGVAIATGRCTERARGFAGAFRYLTVLQRAEAGWRVTAAQSTREATFTPRVLAEVAGALEDYVGSYRTPRGALLRVKRGDAALVLVEPSGKQLPMEPIGPGLFEFKALSPGNGIVRFSFARDGSGQVRSFSRLISGQVDVFPRVSLP